MPAPERFKPTTLTRREGFELRHARHVRLLSKAEKDGKMALASKHRKQVTFFAGVLADIRAGRFWDPLDGWTVVSPETGERLE